MGRYFLLCLEFLSYPLFIIIAFFVSHAMGLSISHSTNVTVVNPVSFILVMLLLNSFRLVFFRFMTRHSSFKKSLNQFINANKISLIGFPLFLLLQAPVEGNVMGFIYLPIAGLLILIITPLLLWKNIKAIKNLRAERLNSE